VLEEQTGFRDADKDAWVSGIESALNDLARAVEAGAWLSGIRGAKAAERKRAERRIRYLARYDALTKVPNRMQFQHLLQQAIARGRRLRLGVALLYIDMDRFKEVNDTFGHASGDRVLELLTERLTRALSSDTVIGRLAGDEFAMFVDGLATKGEEAGEQVAQLARTVLDTVGAAFHVSQQEVVLTVSIGVAFCPRDADNVIDLIRNADAAMYYSKQNGGNTFAFYSQEMNAAAVERLMLKSKLRRAVERDEFVVQYQPKVDLRDGRVVGAEALLRWRLPGHGDIPPSQFIPIAEENDLISAIGAHRIVASKTDSQVVEDSLLASDACSLGTQDRTWITLRSPCSGGEVLAIHEPTGRSFKLPFDAEPTQLQLVPARNSRGLDPLKDPFWFLFLRSGDEESSQDTLFVRTPAGDEHALGAWANQRPLVLDQHSASRHERRGHLHDARRARATVLQYLPHPGLRVTDDNRRSSASLSPTMNSWKAWKTHRARPARPSRKPRRSTYIYTKSASGLPGTHGQTRSRTQRLRWIGDATRLSGSRARPGASRSAFNPNRAEASSVE